MQSFAQILRGDTPRLPTGKVIKHLVLKVKEHSEISRTTIIRYLHEFEERGPVDCRVRQQTIGERYGFTTDWNYRNRLV